MKIEEVKQKYKDEWVLGEVLKEDTRTGEPLEINVIAHSRNRDDTYDAMLLASKKYKHLCHLYSGEIPKTGYAVAFYARI